MSGSSTARAAGGRRGVCRASRKAGATPTGNAARKSGAMAVVIMRAMPLRQSAAHSGRCRAGPMMRARPKAAKLPTNSVRMVHRRLSGLQVPSVKVPSAP